MVDEILFVFIYVGRKHHFSGWKMSDPVGRSSISLQTSAVFSSGAENPNCSKGPTLLSVKACNRVRSLLHSTRFETISRVGMLVANSCLRDSAVPAKP